MKRVLYSAYDWSLQPTVKMSVDVEYIPSCCIEKMHLHAAIFDLPVETELVNEPTSAENFSRFLNLHVHVLS